MVHVEGGGFYILRSPNQRSFMSGSEFRLKLHSFCKEMVMSHIRESVNFAVSNLEDMVSIHGVLVLFLSIPTHPPFKENSSNIWPLRKFCC